MKNAIKYGLLIGVLSGLWIVAMHSFGVYNQNPDDQKYPWMEFTSIIIPFVGLYLGIKNYRDHINKGRMEFFEGLFEGFKIIIIGGIITAAFTTLYLQYVGAEMMRLDYMQRIFGAGSVGILFDLIISLLLMNKQRNL